jgi:hypothetical protein
MFHLDFQQLLLSKSPKPEPSVVGYKKHFKNFDLVFFLLIPMQPLSSISIL